MPWTVFSRDNTPNQDTLNNTWRFPGGLGVGGSRQNSVSELFEFPGSDLLDLATQEQGWAQCPPLLLCWRLLILFYFIDPSNWLRPSPPINITIPQPRFPGPYDENAEDPLQPFQAPAILASDISFTQDFNDALYDLRMELCGRCKKQ